MLFDSLVLGSDHISCQPRRRFSRDAPPTPHGKRAAPPRLVGQMPRPCIYGFLQSSWAFLNDNCQILTEPPSPLCHLWSSFWCYGFRRAHFKLDFLGKVGCLCELLFPTENPISWFLCDVSASSATPRESRLGWSWDSIARRHSLSEEPLSSFQRIQISPKDFWFEQF